MPFLCSEILAFVTWVEFQPGRSAVCTSHPHHGIVLYRNMTHFVSPTKFLGGNSFRLHEAKIIWWIFLLSPNYTCIYKNIGKKLRTLSNSIQKVSNPIIVSWSLKQSEYSFNPSNICGCQERYGIVCNFPSEKFVQLLHVHCVLLFLPLKPFFSAEVLLL